MATIFRWKDWVLNFCCYCFFKSSEIRYQENIFLLCWGNVEKKLIGLTDPSALLGSPSISILQPQLCRAQGFRGSKVGHSNQETVELRTSRGLFNLVHCSEPLQNLTQTTSSAVYCQRQSLVSQDSPLGDSWSNLRPAHNQHGAPERRKSGGVLLRPLLSLFPGAEAEKVSKLPSPPSLTPGGSMGRQASGCFPKAAEWSFPSRSARCSLHWQHCDEI